MKAFFITLFISLTLSAYSQCGLEISSRENGKIVYGTIPKPLGNINKSVSVGISYQKIDNLDFVALLIRSKKEDLKEEIKLTLQNNKIIVGKIINSTTGFSQGSDYSLGIYLITKSDYNNLGLSNLKKINFKFISDHSEEINVMSNSDCLKTVIYCLSTNSQKASSNKVPNPVKLEVSTPNKVSTLDELDKKNGFRELQFGKEVGEIDEYKFKFEKEENGEKIYTIRDENIKINGVKVYVITCHFVFDKLVMLELLLSEESTYRAWDLLRESFGDPEISHPDPKYLGNGESMTFYSWEGKKVHLTHVDHVKNKLYNDILLNNDNDNRTLEYCCSNYSELKEEARKQFLKSKKSDL